MNGTATVFLQTQTKLTVGQYEYGMNCWWKEIPFLLVVDKKMTLLLSLSQKYCILSVITNFLLQADGTYYPPNMLYQICVGVERYLMDNGFAGLNIIQDLQYNVFQDSLDARLTSLTLKVPIVTSIQFLNTIFTVDQPLRL